MKLEFFPDGSADCPLVLLYGNAPGVVRSLASALAALKEGELALHKFPGIEPLGGCTLTATPARRDSRLLQCGPTEFIWELSPSGRDQVVGLLAPFSMSSFSGGFQWLEPKAPGGVAFVISDGRHW